MSILNRTVHEIIAQKDVPVLPSFKTVKDAIRLMENCGSHAVGVTVGDYFVGLFTNSDLIKKVIRSNKKPEETVLAEVMTLDPVTVARDCTFRQAFFYMCKYGYSHLPVVERNRFYGVVSEDDLRQAVAKDLMQIATENNMLMSYIKGESYGLSAVAAGNDEALTYRG